MRLVFVTDTLMSGGAERVISILANHFAKKYNVEILCLMSASVFYTIDSSVKIVQVEDYEKNSIKKLWFLRKYLLPNDIIIPFMEAVYCKVLLSLAGKKRTIIPSERNDPNKMERRWTVIRRLFMSKITKFVVQTNKIKEFYPFFFKKKVVVIPNPVDKTQYTTDEWNPNSKIILAVARTEPQKNYSMMIMAVAAMHEIHPEFRLEIYGCRDKETEYARHLFALIDELNANEYIHINGRSKNVAELYSAAYMFVMSSDYEGLSNSLIEALCSGRPVISTKVSGATDLIKDGENGLLVDIGDQKGLTAAMCSLIENKELAYTIAGNATKIRSLLAKEKICSEWEKIIMK